MKQDIYQMVTNRIITLLHEGIVPWQSPHFAKVGFPKNFLTNKPYQGINVFLLGSLQYTTPWFLTYLQAMQLGGHVRKGEQGCFVVKYGTYQKTLDAPQQDPLEPETRRYLKGYTVFHASQIDGVEFPKPTGLTEMPHGTEFAQARDIVSKMPNPPVIKEGVAQAYYQPATDSVHLPERCYFVNEESYYTTLFHELVHYAAIRIMPRRCLKAGWKLVHRRGIAA